MLYNPPPGTPLASAHENVFTRALQSMAEAQDTANRWSLETTAKLGRHVDATPLPLPFTAVASVGLTRTRLLVWL